MKKFEVGKSYVTYHHLDSSVTLKMTVISRTEKTVTVKMPHLGKARKRVGYYVFSDSECVNAPGGYAMFEAANEISAAGNG